MNFKVILQLFIITNRIYSTYQVVRRRCRQCGKHMYVEGVNQPSVSGGLVRRRAG